MTEIKLLCEEFMNDFHCCYCSCGVAHRLPALHSVGSWVPPLCKNNLPSVTTMAQPTSAEVITKALGHHLLRLTSYSITSPPLLTSYGLIPPRSVLEPGRTLTLAERGGEGAEVVKAAEGFLLVATMNPGGGQRRTILYPSLSSEPGPFPFLP